MNVNRHELMIEATVIFVQGHLDGIDYSRANAIWLAAKNLGLVPTGTCWDHGRLQDTEVEMFLEFLGLGKMVLA